MRSDMERLPLVGPLEWLGHRAVEVSDKVQHLIGVRGLVVIPNDALCEVSKSEHQVRVQPIWMGLLVLVPSQVTVTVPVPGRVEVPMFQLHETIPLTSATLDPNPWAVEAVPAGV